MCANLADVSANDLLDFGRVNAGALDDGLLHQTKKVGGVQSGQATVLAANGGTDGVDNNDGAAGVGGVGVGHSGHLTVML